MKAILALVTFFLLLYCATTLLAADPVPSCVPEHIEIEKQKQTIEQLRQALFQAQFKTSQQTVDAAKAEQARLEGLLPKDTNPKQESAQTPTGPEKK